MQMIMKNKIVIVCCLAILLTSFTFVNKKVPNPNLLMPPLVSPIQVDGILRLNKTAIENFRGQSVYTNYFLVQTIFPNDTMGVLSFLNRQYAGVVNLNNNPVHYYDNITFYADTTFDLSNANGFYWNVEGSSTVSPFTYVNTNPFPSFIYDNNNFPTSIDTSQDLQITLKGILHADSVLITINRSDSVGRPPFIVKSFSVNATTFVIEKQLLKQYNLGQTLNFQIELSNYNNQTISGKNYYFINSFDYRKKVTIQPQN